MEEMPNDKINENIRYYDEYISSKGGKVEQEAEIESIGEPRLIARTIIESYKMSKEYKNSNEKDNTTHYYREEYNNNTYNEGSNADWSNQKEETTLNKTLSTIKRVAIIVGIILVLFIVLKFAINIFFTLVLPVALIYILVKYIVGLFHR